MPDWWGTQERSEPAAVLTETPSALSGARASSLSPLEPSADASTDPDASGTDVPGKTTEPSLPT